MRLERIIELSGQADEVLSAPMAQMVEFLRDNHLSGRSEQTQGVAERWPDARAAEIKEAWRIYLWSLPRALNPRS